MESKIPLWQAVVVALLGTVSPILVQYIKGRQESGDKLVAASSASQTDFMRQLAEAGARVPALLADCERLIRENATLGAKLELLDARMKVIEEEKMRLEARLAEFSNLEAENLELRREVARLKERISHLESLNAEVFANE